MCRKMVCTSELKRFMNAALQVVGTSPAKAETLADVLTFAELKGHPSHGFGRFPLYIKDIENGLMDPYSYPCIVKENESTALVNGNNGLGSVNGIFCMDLAISKASCTGIGFVVAQKSNHFGMASYYALRAINQGMIGMVLSNSSPLMAPTRSKVPGLGTNPLSFVAPGCGDFMALDIATSAVSVGKIEVKKRNGERLPAGWAQDTMGNETDDPDTAIAAGCLMPLGGLEINSGYKGYGLALMVDTLCAGLSGSKFGPFIRKWSGDACEEADISHCFFALDPNKFSDGFSERMSCIMNTMRSLPPICKTLPVLVPGDKERQHEFDSGGVVSIPDELYEKSVSMARELNISPLSFK